MIDLDTNPQTRPTRVGAESRRRRRSQKERSAETRAILLEVTVGCLAELGYVGTTSKLVAERAGLSRGAQLHHFGTKAQLVTMALGHLFERRLEEFREGFGALPKGADPVEAAVDLLWSIFQGPSGYAYLELAGAARTDPDLREAIVALNAEMDARVDALFRDLFAGSVGAEEHFDIAWTALFCLLEGLAIERVVRADDRRIDRVVAVLKQVLPAVLRRKEDPCVAAAE